MIHLLLLLSVQVGSDSFGELSSEDHHFESVEVGEVLSEDLLFHDFSFSVFEKSLNGLRESCLVALDVLSVVELFDVELGGLDSLSGDDLSDKVAGG